MDILNKGMGMAVGNGANTKCWYHSWNAEEILLAVATGDPPAELLQCNVKDAGLE